MNERIKELLKQSTTVRHGVIVPRTVTTEYHVDQEKFAELIVKECMKVANTYQNRGGNCYVDNMIAKHFGVE